MYGKVRPDGQQGVAAHHQLARLAMVPSRPIEPVTHGRSSGSTSLPSNAFAAPAPSRSATSVSSLDAAARALPDQQGDLVRRR